MSPINLTAEAYTAATFGEPEYVPIDEAHPQNPTNPYGESKLIVEKMLKWCDLAHGLKFCALRYFNVARWSLSLIR